MKTFVAEICIVAAFVGITIGEILKINPCDSGRDADILSDVSQLTVTPCAEADNEEPCKLQTGSVARITITFKPSVQPNRLKSSLAWVSGSNDMAFRGMRPNACGYMTCPVKVNEDNVFNATLNLSGDLPKGLYPLKAKLQELSGAKRVFACVLFSIELVGPEEGTTSTPE